MFETLFVVCAVLGFMLIATPPGWIVLILIWLLCVK
jgi:hypothetical protein